MWSIRGRASSVQLAVQFSVCCLLRPVLVLLLLLLLFFFFSPSLVLLFYFIAYILLSVRSILPLGLCCGCLLWVLFSLTHSSSLLIYRYTDTDTQILSVSSFVSSIRQLRIWQLILAPSWCSITSDTFPSCQQSSVIFSLCRGLPLSSAPGDAVSRVIN